MNGIEKMAVDRFLSKEPDEVRRDLGQALKEVGDTEFRVIVDVVLTEIDRRWPK